MRRCFSMFPLNAWKRATGSSGSSVAASGVWVKRMAK